MHEFYHCGGMYIYFYRHPHEKTITIRKGLVAWTQNGFLLPWGGLASQWLCFKAGNEPLLKAAHTSFGIPVELLKNQSDDNAETPETHFVYLMDQTFSQQPVGITSEAEINSCLYQWGSSRLTYGTSLYLQVKVRLQSANDDAKLHRQRLTVWLP